MVNPISCFDILIKSIFCSCFNFFCFFLMFFFVLLVSFFVVSELSDGELLRDLQNTLY